MEKELEYFIHVEYCTNCHSHSWCTHHNQAKYHQTFIKLKNLIYEEFKQQKQKIKITSNQVPQYYLPIKQQQNKYYDSKNKKYIFYPNIGAFDVTINGQNIFQKKKDNSWPSFDNILNLLYLKIKNKHRINHLSKNQRNITSQNEIQFESENNKMQQRTLYKQKSSSHNKDFSLTNHFKTYHTQGSSTTICNQQTKNILQKKTKQPLNSSRLKINVQNIQKLKEALQHNQVNQNYKVGNAQKSKHKQILINLSSIEQQNGQQNLLNCNLKKVQCQKRSQNKIISEKSLSRKKLQEWETDLNLAEDKFSKIQNKVSVERKSKIPYLQLEINENPNQQLQTNLNSSLREEVSRQKYNKKNVQSFHDHPMSLFQNQHSSRFKQLNLQEQDYINWKSHENIIKSKKIQQIETYIQANQQYKNQQLRKIYGNWKIQGTYSQHLNYNNQKKQSIFKIKKNKNVKIFSTNKNKKIIHQNQNLKANQKYVNDQISEDNESSSSTVQLKHKIYIGNAVQKQQTIQAKQSLHQRHKNKKQPRNTGNTASGFSKLNELIQNKKQSKSLMKSNEINSFNKLKYHNYHNYHKANSKIQQSDKNNKGEYDKIKFNAIEMGQKKLNGKMINSTKNYRKPLLFKQVKSFHFQNKNYQKENNSPQKLRMVSIKNSYSKNISDNKQNIKKKSSPQNQKENFEILKKEGFYYKQSLQQEDTYKIKSKNNKRQKLLTTKKQSQILHNAKLKQKLHYIQNTQFLQKNFIQFQTNNQNQAEFQNQQKTLILNKQSKKHKQTTNIPIKSSRLSLSKNQVNIVLQRFSNRQIIQNIQKVDKTLDQKTLQIAQNKNDYQTTQQKNKQSNDVLQEEFNLSQVNEIDEIECNTQINENQKSHKKNKTHKKSKFSGDLNQDLKEQEQLNQDLKEQEQFDAVSLQNSKVRNQQNNKVKNQQFKIDLKEMNQNSQRQSLIRSQSCNQSLIDKQQKQPCKCTLRLQQSHRRKCESQQKSIIKHRQNEKRYIQTKRRRQQLQKKREQYLRQRQLSKHNKISKNNSMKQKSRVKSYVTNILNQRQDQQNDHKKISRVIIQNKKNRKQYKKQKHHKQHSKTIDLHLKKQKKQRNQFQQEWYTIFQENNSPQSILNKSYRQNANKFLNTKKSKNNLKIKKQKNFKKYYQTTAIQTTCLNEASVQTELIQRQFNQDKMIESDNLNKCANFGNENGQTRKSKYFEQVNEQNKKQQNKNGLNSNKINKNDQNSNKIKMSSQINVKIQRNQIIQIQRVPERVNVRSQAQIVKQLYGQQIQKQRQKYQSMLKNNKIFGIEKWEESQKDEQFQLKSAIQIYDMNLKLFDNKLNLSGFKSNCQKNINFMKTTLMLANKNQLLIVRLFQDYKQNIIYKKRENFNTLNRLYGVWICVNYRWKIILVNDIIPVIFQNQNNKYKPLFCQPLNQCIWPLILEKAISVASGGYTNYLKLSCGQIFHMLTGSNYIDFKINQDLDKNKQFLKYISQNQRKNYIIYCEKNAKNIKQHENNISQIKIFSIISKKIVNDQQILFKMQEMSNAQNQSKTQIQPYYIKYQRFCQTFKSSEILHLRQNHNYCQVYLSNNAKQNNDKCNKFFFVAQLSFEEEAFGCITISNKYRGNLKSYLYRQQNGDTQLLKLVGEASKNNKKQLFFDCCFHSCKYLLFVQTQHDDSTLTYLGQGRPNIIIKQQILQNGLKNNITQYLPVSINNNGKINQFTKSGQLLGRSRMTNLDITDQSNNVNTSKGFQQLRQKFIQLIIKGKHNG